MTTSHNPDGYLTLGFFKEEEYGEFLENYQQLIVKTHGKNRTNTWNVTVYVDTDVEQYVICS